MLIINSQLSSNSSDWKFRTKLIINANPSTNPRLNQDHNNSLIITNNLPKILTAVRSVLFKLFDCVVVSCLSHMATSTFDGVGEYLKNIFAIHRNGIEKFSFRGPIRKFWWKIQSQVICRALKKFLDEKLKWIEGCKMRLPYMKILVYILTFVGYCYSGYGSSVLSSLRDAVLSAEIIFGDVFKNFITVSKKFKTVHDIFDSAVEENCVYECPGSKLETWKILISVW